MLINMFKQLRRLKPFPDSSVTTSKNGLLRNITLFQLTMMGVGSTLGTGIFFALAETVPLAGPAVILSFTFAGLVAGLTALCYAEVSSTLPVSGSSYTFTYMTLGEGAAMVVASCLLLEWGISGAAVAVGWSSYLNDLISIATNLEIPMAIRSSPLVEVADGWGWNGESYINLPAVLLVLMCSLLLLRGSRESAIINAILTISKLGVLFLFVVMTLLAFKVEHFEPFIPFGVEGVGAAAAIIFFSYIGLDAVVNASEETINPQRNVPLAIIGALIIVTFVYILVAISSLGVQPAADFAGHNGNLTMVLQRATSVPWLSGLLAAGAVISIFSVTLVCLYGQSRIFFAMARDKVIPEVFCKVDPHSRSPKAGVLLSTVIVTPLAGFVPAQLLWSIVSLGTLITFITVAVSLIMLRSYFKRMPPGYKTPFYPLIPVLSIGSCIYLLMSLQQTVYVLFAVWILLSAIFYFLYSQSRATP
jgi:basic amino acid/polyamine antiporter, APA family